MKTNPVARTLIFLTTLACNSPLPETSNLQSYGIEPGRYRIRSVNSGMCLDIPGGKADPGTLLQQYHCNDSKAQIFEFKRGAGEAFVISSNDPSRVLDLRGPSKDKGALLQLYTPGGGTNQLFTLDAAGNADEYLIRSVHSGLVLDVGNMSREVGAKVHQWSESGSVNQLWLLEPVKAADWKLVWADEFNAGEIDQTKWAFEVQKSRWVNNELQSYTNARPENTRIENGNLVIEARKDNFEGQEYSSARLKTQGKASFKYGRYEARMQLPRGKGTWPAFWMMPDDQSRGWPACGEIDIMEHVGYEQDYVHATTHSNTYSWKSASQRTAKRHVPGVSDGFHVYAVEWYPDRIDAFVDGVKYYTSPNDNTGDDAYPFNKNFHIILNLAVGGDWGGVQGVDESIWPQRMLVDYVRVYQK